MNKRTILASLNNIANSLDISGLNNEATQVTNVMKRIASLRELNPEFRKELDEANRRAILMEDPNFDFGDEYEYPIRSTFPMPKPNTTGEFPDYSWPDGVMGGEIRFPKPKPKPNTTGGFPPYSYPTPQFNDVAVVEMALNKNDVLVRNPGPLGKRHIVKWQIKSPAFPGSECEVDWEAKSVVKALPLDEVKMRENLEIMRSENVNSDLDDSIFGEGVSDIK